MLTFDPIPASWQKVRDIEYLPGLRKTCWNCGAETPYADINFGARLCSVECQDRKWHEYMVASMGEDGFD